MSINIDDFTIKELREKLNISREDIEDELGIPVRTLQNWENGYRECPDYTEELVKKELVRMGNTKRARIVLEKEFGEEKLRGYSCNLYNVETGRYDLFSWFYPINNDTISNKIMYEMWQLINLEYEIVFI